MELLRMVAQFTKSIEDKWEIDILCLRSILEQSCVVYHRYSRKYIGAEKSFKKKVVITVTLSKYHENYENVLLRSNIESLSDGRAKFCKTSAIKCMNSGNPRIYDLFSKQKQTWNETQK